MKVFFNDFLCLRGTFPWVFLHYDTIILQRIRIIVWDAGFEPGTSAPEVWCTTSEPPYFHPMNVAPLPTAQPLIVLLFLTSLLFSQPLYHLLSFSPTFFLSHQFSQHLTHFLSPVFSLISTASHPPSPVLSYTVHLPCLSPFSSASHLLTLSRSSSHARPHTHLRLPLTHLLRLSPIFLVSHPSS